MVYSQPILPNPDRFYGWGFLFYELGEVGRLF